jgi:hypothetical protein
VCVCVRACTHQLEATRSFVTKKKHCEESFGHLWSKSESRPNFASDASTCSANCTSGVLVPMPLPVQSRNSWGGLATRYGLRGSGIESSWGEIFRSRPDWPWVPPSLLYNGYPVSFPGVRRPGLALTSHPIQRRVWRKSRAVPLLLWVFMVCATVISTLPALPLPMNASS